MCCEKLPNMSVSEDLSTGITSVHSAAVGCSARAPHTSAPQLPSSSAEYAASRGLPLESA